MLHIYPRVKLCSLINLVQWNAQPETLIHLQWFSEQTKQLMLQANHFQKHRFTAHLPFFMPEQLEDRDHSGGHF